MDEGALALDVPTRVYGADGHRESCIVLFFRRKLPLRDVIAEKVRAEVEKANAARGESQSVRYLTDEDLSWARGGATKAPGKPDAAREIARALDAFQKGRYFVVVDGSRRGDLDEVITLTADTKIQFVRVL